MRHWIPVVLFVLLSSLLVVGTSSADWPMFQGSLDKSGYYNGTLPEDDNVMWTYESDIFYLNTPTVADGVVYFSGYDYNVHAVDIRNGEELWSTPLDWITIQSSAAVDTENGLVYIGNLNTLFALDTDSGDIVWRFRNQKNFMETGWPEVSCPAVYDDFVYFGSVDGNLYKFPAEDPNGDGTMTVGEAEWNYQTGDLVPDSEGIFYAPVTVCPDLDLVLGATAVEGGANPGALYAINDADGSLEWRAELATNTPVVNISIPGQGSHSGSGPSWDLDSGTNGIVWVPNGDRLFALDITDGSEEYVKTANNWIFGMTPSWDDNNVYIGDDDGYITAYDKDTGSKAWEKDMGGPIRTSPVHDDNGNMYTSWNNLGTSEGIVSCFDMSTRDVVWEYNTTGYTLASFGADNGMLFISVADVSVPVDSHLLFAFGDHDMDVDLQVKTVGATAPIEGTPSPIVAKVFNDGTMSAWDVEVEFYDGDPDGSGDLIGTAIAPRLLPGVSTPVFYEWIPDTNSGLEVYAVVDPDNDVTETIESNNQGSGEISIIPGGEAPTCSIVSISPDDLYQVGTTTIDFSGDADDDGTVEYYTWTSSIDGFLSSSEDFDLSVQSLSPGAHYITLQVEDDDGMMSENASAMLFVRPDPLDDWYRSGADMENTGYSMSGGPTLPSVEWSVDRTNIQQTLSGAAVVDDVMYYCSLNRTYAIDIEDGTELWTYSYNDVWSYVNTPAVDIDEGLVIISGNALVALDIDDGDEEWAVHFGGFEFSGPVIDDWKVYAHSHAGKNLSAYNLTTGIEEWRFEVSSGYLYSSPAVGFDHVYVTSYSTDDDNEGYYATYGLDPDTGAVDWRWRLGDGSIGGIGVPLIGAALSISSPTLYSYGGTDYVVVADITGDVYAFEPDGEQPRDSIDSDGSGPTPLTGAADDGEWIWRTNLDQDLIASTSYHDGHVFAVTWMGEVNCLDADTGNVVWSEDLSMPFWAAPTITNDTIYLAGIDSYLYSLDIDTGNVNWRYLTKPFSFIYGQPALYGGSLYLPGGPDPWLFLWSDDVYKFSDFVDMPEVSVSPSMVVLPDSIPVNDTIQFMVGAANNGLKDTTAVISVYINETDMAHRLGAAKVDIPAGGMNGFIVEWNTTNMSGEQTIIVMVTDMYDPYTDNNVAEVSAYVVRPGEKPIAEIIAIEPNPVERSSSNDVYFSGEGHTAGNITDYLWNVSGEFLSDEAEFEIGSDDTLFDLGDNDITFTVKDDTGQWADEVMDTLTITAPGSKPEAEIIDISPNPADIEDTVSFEGEGHSGSGKNITGYRWWWSGGTLSTQAEFEEDADTFGTGSWPIYFEVEDEDGKKSTTVDETLKVVSGDPPEVTITAPEDEDEVSGTVNITGTAESDEDVILVEVAYSEVDEDPDWENDGLDVEGLEDWYAHWDTDGFSGDMEIHARAKSESGLESEVVMITVTIMSSLPTVEITYPTGGDLSGSEITITGTASDDGYVDKVHIKFGAGSWNLATDESANGTWEDWSYDWNYSNYDDGDKVNIRARATDDDGDQTTDTVQVEIVKPNVAPEIEIVYPASDSDVLTHIVMCEGSAIDEDGEITKIQLAIDDIDFDDPLEIDVSEEGYYYWYIELDTRIYTADDYRLYARAQDNDGDFSDHDSVAIRIDNREPEAIIDSVKPGVAVWYKDTIIMKGHASMEGDYDEDRDIAEWEWTTNRGGVLGTNATIVVKAEDLNVGVHEIELRVMGSNGIWSEEVSTQVNVKKAKSSGGSDDEWWEIPGMEATAVMTALAAAVLIFRKRR